MSHFNYQVQVELLFAQVEQFLDRAIDKDEADLDYEKTGNLLSISFPNHSKIILNTQAPLQQIWLATKAQGYHFNFDGKTWVCERTHQPFDAIFKNAFQQQLI